MFGPVDDVSNLVALDAVFEYLKPWVAAAAVNNPRSPGAAAVNNPMRGASATVDHPMTGAAAAANHPMPGVSAANLPMAKAAAFVNHPITWAAAAVSHLKAGAASVVNHPVAAAAVDHSMAGAAAAIDHTMDGAVDHTMDGAVDHHMDAAAVDHPMAKAAPDRPIFRPADDVSSLVSLDVALEYLQAWIAAAINKPMAGAAAAVNHPMTGATVNHPMAGAALNYPMVGASAAVNHHTTRASAVVDHPMTRAADAANHPMTGADDAVNHPVAGPSADVDHPMTRTVDAAKHPVAGDADAVNHPVAGAAAGVNHLNAGVAGAFDHPMTRAADAANPPLTGADDAVDLAVASADVHHPMTGAVDAVDHPMTGAAGAVDHPMTGAAGAVDHHMTGAVDHPETGAAGAVDHPMTGAVDHPMTGAAGAVDYPMTGAVDQPMTRAAGAVDHRMIGAAVATNYPMAWAAAVIDHLMAGAAAAADHPMAGAAADVDHPMAGAVDCLMAGAAVVVDNPMAGGAAAGPQQVVTGSPLLHQPPPAPAVMNAQFQQNDAPDNLVPPPQPVNNPQRNPEINLPAQDDDRAARSNVILEEVGSPFGPMFVMRMDIQAIQDRFPIREFGFLMKIKRTEPFSPFIKCHRKSADLLMRLFQKMKYARELKEFVIGIRDSLNEGLFIYALTAALYHTKNFRKVWIPSMVEVFPHKFVPHEELRRVQEDARRLDKYSLQPIFLGWGPADDSTSADLEQRMNYWREDYGLNCFYWHWHVANPIDTSAFHIHRKGELFYYIHQQILARYDAERMSMGFPRVEPLDPGKWNLPIPQGYFPDITINNTGKMYSARPDNITLMGVDREDYGLDNYVDKMHMKICSKRVNEMVSHTEVIYEENSYSIHQPDLFNKFSTAEIIGDTIAGDVVHSINPMHYGELNMAGHALIAYAHDPMGKHTTGRGGRRRQHNSEMGVMGDPMTAARDPLFYRWYKFIDNLFQKDNILKHSYTQAELEIPGVLIQCVDAVRFLGVRPRDPVYNQLETGWAYKNFDLTRGIDFATISPVNLLLKHMEHKRFEFQITINNETLQDKMVLIRLFLAPSNGEDGEPLMFEQQRSLWMEMDKFTQMLEPGINFVLRMPKDSSVATHTHYTFKEIESGLPNKKPMGEAYEYNEYAACGWPRHLLLPRGGSDRPMDFQLFTIVTDWKKDTNSMHQQAKNDKVTSDYESDMSLDNSGDNRSDMSVDNRSDNRSDMSVDNRSETSSSTSSNENENQDEESSNVKERYWKKTDCRDNGASYCGLRDSKYPDNRAMGFPFDRFATLSLNGKPVCTYKDYDLLNNVYVRDLTIQHFDQIIEDAAEAPAGEEEEEEDEE